MTPPAHFALPIPDQRILNLVAPLVPAASRPDWLRTWQAELWHLHNHHHRRRPATLIPDHYIGLTRDALWLRTDACRTALEGTPTLCLASLLACTAIALLAGLILAGGRQSLLAYLAGPLNRSLVAAVIVTVVALATSSTRHARHIRPDAAPEPLIWLRRQLFFAAKILLTLVTVFFLSADLCLPIHPLLPNTADLLQVLSFVLLALVGVRWAVLDQQRRCKRCLHILATPARVGRPSHNLLEWNGTELTCKHGHGLLSIPEMETSWCSTSQWIDNLDQWNRAATL